MSAAIAGKVKAQVGTVSGSIAGAKGLSGHLNNAVQLVGSLATAYTAGAPPYEGVYEVTPTVEGLSLPTRQKYMTDDVKILAIPIYEVGNPSGGSTVYIADEIEKE